MSDFSEVNLQELICNDPATFLPGKLINQTVPRKWLLVAEEIYIGSKRADILFLDQDAIPTLVECKLERNASGITWQLLEYVTNARYKWTSEYLIDNALSQRKNSTKALLEDFKQLDIDLKIEHFFRIAEFNIINAKARLVFYMDNAPENLVIAVHDLRQYMRASNLEIFLFDLSNNNMPTLRDIDFSYIRSELDIFDRNGYGITFYQALEAVGKEGLFDEILKICDKKNLKSDYNENWVTFRKKENNHVVFYITKDKSNALFLEDYKTENKYNIDYDNLDYIKELIEKLADSAE